MTRNDPVVSTFSGVRVDPSYQEIPEREAVSMRRAAVAMLAHMEELSPWRPYVLRGLLPEDVTRYSEGRGGGGSASGLADPFVELVGPSGQISGYWVPSDHSAPTPPADITWTTAHTISPRELLAFSTLSNDSIMNLRGFTHLVDGAPVQAIDSGRVTPTVTRELAEALVRAENVAFATGAASTADPFHGLSGLSLTTQASTAALIDDLIEASYVLLAAKRRPNAAFVPVNLAKKIRKLKASTGGSYLFDPNQPLAIVIGPDPDDVVPIVPLDGLPNTVGSVAYVGDFTKIVALWRYMPNGLLAMVAASDLGSTFNTDRTTLRASERLDMHVIPGFEASFRQLTGVDAS